MARSTEAFTSYDDVLSFILGAVRPKVILCAGADAVRAVRSLGLPRIHPYWKWITSFTGAERVKRN